MDVQLTVNHLPISHLLEEKLYCCFYVVNGGITTGSVAIPSNQVNLIVLQLATMSTIVQYIFSSAKVLYLFYISALHTSGGGAASCCTCLFRHIVPARWLVSLIYWQSSMLCMMMSHLRWHMHDDE
jgi:hypothetical protein